MAKAKKEAPAEGELLTGSEVDTQGKQLAPREPKSETKSDPAPGSELVKSQSVIAGIPLTSGELKAALDAQTEHRKLIADFIKKHLKTGVDYIRIHVVKNCAQEDKRRGSCRNSNHFSKDILAKPGQEKIFSLFQLSSELVKDEETIEMLDGMKNLVAYKCIVKRGDQIVAEGRGAAIVGDNRRDVNATIKIAEKRARMDACLSLGFSEYFVQDLDDPDYQNQKKAAEEQAAGRAEADDGTGLPPRPGNAPIDQQERTILAKWMLKRGFDSAEEQLELLKINGIPDPKQMTSKQARDMILKMQRASFAAPGKTDTVVDDVPESEADLAKGLDEAVKDLEAKKPDVPPEPELVVDDELKNEVQLRASTIGLNQRGVMWLMQRISGKPFAKWERLTDEEWRKAYQIVTAILDGDLDVDDHHLAGVVPLSDDEKEALDGKAAASGEEAGDADQD